MYGRTFEEISKSNKPQKISRAWGDIKYCVKHKKYKLTSFQLNKDYCLSLRISKTDQARLFLLNGQLIINIDGNYGVMQSNESINLPENISIDVVADEFSEFFIFSKNNLNEIKGSARIKADKSEEREQSKEILNKIGDRTYDKREKYWGRIETIFSDEIAGKVMHIKKGIQGSLEYHLEKVEAYYIHSGKLSVGLRYGRAEDRSIILNAGESFIIEPGTMHSRYGVTNCKVIEISTRDNDADSFLVTDGNLKISDKS